MLENENIICVSWLEWDSIPLVMHQMMRRLSKSNRVLFVDPPVALSNLCIDPPLWKRHLSKTKQWWDGPRQISGNLFVYYPPPLLLQYGHLAMNDKLNRVSTSRAIKAVARRLKFIRPVLWLYHPYAIGADGQFGEKVTVYDCNDDVGYFFCRNFDKRERLSGLEENITRKSDVVFATSRHLYNLRSKQNPNTHYLPSAVDVELFRMAADPGLGIAPEVAELPAPVIGFVGGMVNSKMNWRWVCDAAAARPDWSFVFVGPCVEKPPRYILDRANIRFLGPKTQQELPPYLKGFDVCTIPYQGEDFLKACQPTKAFEYLAAGKPVVSVWIPEMADSGDLVSMAKNSDEFLGYLDAAVADGKNPEKVRRYAEAGRRYSWEQRVETASDLVSRAIREKSDSSKAEG